MSFHVLARRFVQDLERCGATVIANDKTTDCIVFLWKITPGGGKSKSRPANERRIQVTATEKQFPLEIGKRTIIGGWSEECHAWGFWDVMRHTRFSTNSPSFQMHLETLEHGFHDGVATQSRRTTPPEIAVSVSPAFLLWYVQDGAVLHEIGEESLSVPDLLTADPEHEREFLDSSQDESQVNRRFRLVETIRAVRDAKFRPAVLQAYSHKCALCPISLNLVDAAHIVPVKRPGSTDDVTNGLALCRLHHAAYDCGLVGVKADYSVVVNPVAIERLRGLGFLSGLEEFRHMLLARIHHPAEPEVRPRPEYLRTGMLERNWPADQIG